MRLSPLVFAACAAVLTTVSHSAQAGRPIHSAGRTGIGLGAGTISNGLSLKHYMSPAAALQFNVGSFGSRSKRTDVGGVAASADFLLERGPLVKTDLLSLDWSIGLGVGAGSRDDSSAVAAAGVVGLELNLTVVPFDLVVEYRPSLLIHPDVDFEPVDFTGHLRFYFQ